MVTFLKNLTKEAGMILLSYQNKINNVKIKKDKSFVSDADLASEEYIIKNIDKYFPGSKIISEETGSKPSTDKNNDLTWIIDPLDGTTNFLHNFPFYSVSVGVMEKNRLIAGAVYSPSLDELYYAEINKGAYLNNNRIKVSGVNDLNQSLLITGFYYHEGERLDIQIDRFKIAQSLTKSVRRLGAASLDICYVACGKADGYWEDGLSPWDVAGGTIILQESNGKFSDLDGKPGDVFGKTFLYSNKILHKDILNLFNNKIHV